MAHPLAELREHLLYLPNAAEILRIADSYLTSMGRLGTNFVLPMEHAVVKPILDYYTGDLKGWVKYVRGVRNAFGRDSDQWTAMQELYRTVEIRNTQRERRDRLHAAIAMAVKRGLIEDTVDERKRYEKRCVQEWMKQRTLMLDAARRGSSKKKLNEDDRAMLLDEFWDNIDQLIAAGEVPIP